MKITKEVLKQIILEVLEEEIPARGKPAALRRSMGALTGQGGQTKGSPFKTVKDPLAGKDDEDDISAPPGAPGGLEEVDQQEPEDLAKLKTQSMGSSAFAKAGREGRKDAAGELSAQEKGIVDQADKFLLDLAKEPGVDLNTNKVFLTRVLKLVQKRLSKGNQQPTGGQT